MDLHKGTILSFRGSWMSGLASLAINDERRGMVLVHCENAPTVRALDGCFGDVIDNNHCVRQEAIEGKEIYYSTDPFGILEAFTPVDDAPPEMVRIYENEGVR
jgi:hypothetical protein